MNSPGGHWIEATLHWLAQAESSAASEIESAVQQADTTELEALIDVLVANLPSITVNQRHVRIIAQLMAARVVQLVVPDAESGLPVDAEDSPIDRASLISPQSLAGLYDQLLEIEPSAAAHVLQVLALQGDDESIEELAQQLTDSPPSNWEAVALAVSPLWNAHPQVLEYFFERLSGGFVHPTTMAVLVDLANYAVRSAKLNEHPWTDRRVDLRKLLEQMTQRLRQFEQDPRRFGETVEEVQATLADSVALSTALCDGLGLVGDSDACNTLRETMQLSHRKLQTEAAAALARLGDDEGRQRLIELAGDLAARARAVAYADELGFADEIEAELRVPQAIAESELASWLASAEQFGFPPAAMEHLDSRTQYWPSYEDPRDCFLFRYTYNLPTGTVSNVGIASPLCHAFHADLANLPVDDIYAAFAGWQAEHEDIFEVPPTAFNPAQLKEAERLKRYLVERDFEVAEVIALTFFFGEVSLLARVKQEDRNLIAIVDGQELLCYPINESPVSMTPDVILCIYRGRKLLRTFNA